MTCQLRQSVAAFALIRREENDQTLWLAQWNRHWNCYNLVGGHKRPDETFRECAIREVSEELQLREDEDYTVAETPTAHLDYEAWSESAGQTTAYTVEVFQVLLNGSLAIDKIDTIPINRWVTLDEVQLGRTADDRRISPTMKRLVEQVGSCP
jgi:8-oxo-dGTP pyrophosphatase MutT (NUDIX family)